MKLIKHILFILFFLVFSAEFIQNEFSLVKAEPLEGAVEKAKKPTLTMDNWFSGMYQDSLIKYNEDNLDLHPFLIRLHNQVGYNLFGEINVNDAEEGKDHYFFEKKYIKAFLGKDFAGEDTINEKVNKLIYIKSELKKRNIDLILVIAPGKPSYYPEYLSSKYDLSKLPRTNYDAYSEALAKNKVDYIDFKKYFLQLKPTVKYPLFTRLGTHWSVSSSVITADSLFDYMEHQHKITLRHYSQTAGDVSSTPRYSDDDIAKPMDLLSPIPSYPMYYPAINFESDTSKTKPDVLIIGDSFMWNWIEIYPFIPAMFNKNSAFWYYNTEVWWPLDPNRKTKQPVGELNFEEQTMHRDFIIIESTESNLVNFGRNFIEQMYALLKNDNSHISTTHG